ncbi:MAG: complex I subunit 1 family protein, partial [Halobacteria archaeon]|nr:complex I subunit 1 family protein [Halobacteria archaeon]
MATFVETVSNALGISDPSPVLQFVIALVGSALWATVLLSVVGLSAVWFKRKWNARLGDRIAVNRVGPFGLLILVADALKLFSKEVVVPNDTDRLAYRIAPVMSAAAIIMAFALIPWGMGLQIADPEAGLVLTFAFVSIPAIAIVMAGYGSNNKYSFMGFEREVAQTIAYEIPFVIAAASIVPMVPLFLDNANPLQLSHIVQAQQGPLL